MPETTALTLKSLVPRPIKARLRTLHRSWTLKSCLKTIRPMLKTQSLVNEDLASRLIYGWSNEGWSAKPALISYLLNEYRSFKGTMLECGSGLSTLIMSMIAEQTGARIFSLEHDQEWHELMNARLAASGLTASGLILSPLCSYGEYDWYDDRTVPGECQAIDVILCDGPPNSTKGGRYGVLPRMSHLLSENAIIIVDDAQREEETRMIQRWRKESQRDIVLQETFPNFVVLRVCS